ncbi:DUF2778 domain-containing protein, partial [Paraburkholderia sp. NMBU_R16]|uniref:tlde1 domain-containing protein n=1 Tax=Paraburkholderia sp. NMBU_R16 TaxID=2698676 RepID=UPI001565B888
QHAPRVNQQTLVSVNQHRHHQPRRDILILFVARLSSRLSRHTNGRFGISEGCITILSQTQFDKLRQFLLAQETKVIPGTNIKYYGTVEVR